METSKPALTMSSRKNFLLLPAVLICVFTLFASIAYTIFLPAKNLSTNYQTDFFRKNDLLQKQLIAYPESPFLLLLGSSTCAQGLDTNLINQCLNSSAKVFNFCQEGDTHRTLAFAIARYLKSRFPNRLFHFVFAAPKLTLNTSPYLQDKQRLQFYTDPTLKSQSPWLQLPHQVGSRIAFELSDWWQTGIGRNPFRQSSHVHQIGPWGTIHELPEPSLLASHAFTSEYLRISRQLARIESLKFLPKKISNDESSTISKQFVAQPFDYVDIPSHPFFDQKIKSLLNNAAIEQPPVSWHTLSSSTLLDRDFRDPLHYHASGSYKVSYQLCKLITYLHWDKEFFQ